MTDDAEVIRRFAAAWDRKDLAALLALATEDFEYVNPPFAVEPGTRRGKEGLTIVARAQWEVLHSNTIERLESRGGRIVTTHRLGGTIPGSDANIDTMAVARWELRDGLVARCEVLGAGSSFQDAVEQAGLAGSTQPIEEAQDGQDTA